jgi:hypothetical protein
MKRKKLDRSVLPEDVSLVRKEGVYAELGPEGQLLHMGEYENGQRKPGSWALNVASDGSSARVDLRTVFEWHQEQDTADGKPSASLASWAEPWVQRIAARKEYAHREGVKLTCSFCGKFQLEVRKLIAGPGVFICDECISICSDLLAEEAKKQGQ